MKMSIRSLALVFLLGLFSSTAFASMGGEVGSADFFGDSGYQGLPYDQMIERLKNLAADHPKQAEVFNYGMTTKGVTMSGIRIRDIENPGANAPLIIVTGAIHGDEFLGIEDLLPNFVLTTGVGSEAFRKFFAAGGEMIFIPVMNPDGYTAHRRENAHHADLNRDFSLGVTRHADSKEVETQNYTAFIRNELASTGRKLRFTMDYHCCIGATILPWAYGKGVPLNTTDTQRYDLLRTLSKDILGTPAGTPWEILGYTADGSTVDHFLETYGSASIGYEGQVKNEHLYFDKHAAFLDAVVKALNEERL
jgi:hypothetical protein